MRRFLMFTGGLALGIVLGMGTALLLAPMSGRQLIDEAQARFEALKEEARRASEEHKAELEAQLAEMTSGAALTETEAEQEASSS
jgi:gas vesicle protein